MIDLSPNQISTLERLASHGFSIVAFPLYANAVGVRKGSTAALLDPIPSGGFRLYGEPYYLLEGNLSVRVTEKGTTWFVWKKLRIEATAERMTELEAFVAELKLRLEAYT